MKKTKYTPDYLLSIIPDQYNPKHKTYRNCSIEISFENVYNSIDINLISDIEISDVTIKITSKIGKTYNILSLWKNCTHIHNIIFKI